MSKQKRVPEAYKRTTVSTHRTLDAIDALFDKYEAEGTGWQRVRMGGMAKMRVQYQFRDRVYRFDVPLGDTPQEERQRLRALYHGLKSAFEQDAFGIFRMEELLFGYAVVALPTGASTTVAELLGDQLEKHQVPSFENALRALPAPGGR